MTGVGGEEGGRSRQRPVIQGFTVQGKGRNFTLIVKVEGHIMEQKYKCEASLHYREEPVQQQGRKYKEQSRSPCGRWRETCSRLDEGAEMKMTGPRSLEGMLRLGVNGPVEGWLVGKEAKRSH